MENKLDKQQAEQLITWYKANHRSLPWRDTGNPYHVWISEIMLQQTRIEAVLPKYNRFIKELPDIQALADCDDDRLMRLWEGLGYYSRARNLKKCAQKCICDYEGRLPDDPKQLMKLPGIGPYTAGAIASIAYGRAAMAIDGNVLRVIARILLITDDIRLNETKNKVMEAMREIYDKKDIDYAAFNQGLMELGQTVCIPAYPHCSGCPWQNACQAYAKSKTAEIPYRSQLKQRRIADKTILVLRQADRFILHKRKDSGLLAGMYEFISADRIMNRKETIQYLQELSAEPLRIKKLPDSRHVFTHLEWHMKAYEVWISDIQLTEDLYSVTKQQLQAMALPSAFHTYIEWYSLRD